MSHTLQGTCPRVACRQGNRPPAKAMAVWGKLRPRNELHLDHVVGCRQTGEIQSYPSSRGGNANLSKTINFSIQAVPPPGIPCP